MSGPVEACPLAHHHGDHEWLANGALRRYCPGDPVPSGAVEPAPWRFDVPEVPGHVTALKDCDGDVWLRKGKSKWTPASWPNDSGRTFDGLLECAPLEECPDPRATS